MSKSNKVRSFRLSDGTFETIGEIAEAKHISKADVITCLINAYNFGEQISFDEHGVDNEKLEILFELAAEL